MKLRAVVPGEPVPQGRPRFRRAGDHVIAYDPAKSREYKRTVQLVARSRAPERPLEGAVRLTYKFTDIYDQAYWTPYITLK